MTRLARAVTAAAGALHEAADAFRAADLQHRAKPWDGRQAYGDSKLHDVALAWAKLLSKRLSMSVKAQADPDKHPRPQLAALPESVR